MILPRRLNRLWLSLALAAGLAACAHHSPEHGAGRPTPLTIDPVQPSAESTSATLFYRRIERDLLAQGLMRTDGGAIDARFDAADLARNFENIALFNEYTHSRGGFVSRRSAAPLRKWTRPVRVMVHFGASAPEEMRHRDGATVAKYLKRLSRASGHPVSLTTHPAAANYHVFVVSLDEQRALGPDLKALNLGLGDAAIRDLTSQSRNNYCFVYAVSDSHHAGVYSRAVAVIRTEHPDLMRRTCYEEELAQGLGLPNDSPEARPSIFNDDEEFAFLTPHDELLLRILYDRRLRPGMTATQARPIVARIAQELVAARS